MLREAFMGLRRLLRRVCVKEDGRRCVLMLSMVCFVPGFVPGFGWRWGRIGCKRGHSIWGKGKERNQFEAVKQTITLTVVMMSRCTPRNRSRMRTQSHRHFLPSISSRRLSSYEIIPNPRNTHPHGNTSRRNGRR